MIFLSDDCVMIFTEEEQCPIKGAVGMRRKGDQVEFLVKVGEDGLAWVKVEDALPVGSTDYYVTDDEEELMEVPKSNGTKRRN